MKLIKDTTWEEVFDGWRKREAANPGWVHCATLVKGWPDWESWRQHTANQIKADERDWQIFSFNDPIEEIPAMLIGPYTGWQNRLVNNNKNSFKELLEIPEQFAELKVHEGINSIMDGLPFSTEFIGFIRKDNDKIVCLEGHHRALAISFAKKINKDIDYSKASITIALAELPANEINLLDKMLKRGTTKK